MAQMSVSSSLFDMSSNHVIDQSVMSPSFNIVTEFTDNRVVFELRRRGEAAPAGGGINAAHSLFFPFKYVPESCMVWVTTKTSFPLQWRSWRSISFMHIQPLAQFIPFTYSCHNHEEFRNENEAICFICQVPSSEYRTQYWQVLRLRTDFQY